MPSFLFFLKVLHHFLQLKGLLNSLCLFEILATVALTLSRSICLRLKLIAKLETHNLRLSLSLRRPILKSSHLLLLFSSLVCDLVEVFFNLCCSFFFALILYCHTFHTCVFSCCKLHFIM